MVMDDPIRWDVSINMLVTQMVKGPLKIQHFFMGNFICVPLRKIHGSDRLRLMQTFLQILNFILIYISLTRLIIELINAGYLY